MTRRKRIRAEQIVAETTTPIFLISPERRVLSFNAGCERLTSWPASEIIGQICEYVTAAESGSIEALTACLCPPAEALAGRTVCARISVPCRTHEPSPKQINFQPLFDENGTVAAVLGIVTDLADLSSPRESNPVQELHAELAVLRNLLRRRFGSQMLICRSEQMVRVAQQAAIARGATAAVLVYGEMGTGREHVARAIHYEGESRTRSFVPLDCKSLSTLELKQILHRFFESAREDEALAPGAALKPGTVFLSHVENLSRDLQQLIVESFRSDWAQRAGLRLMGSTTLDPEELAEGERFRPDFYHLLTPLCIALPPLRRRGDDLRFLAQHLLEELNRGDARQFNGFGDDVWEKFQEYNWPGNVDELLAVIQEARAACDEPLIRAKHLPYRFRTGLDAQAVGPVLRPQVSRLEPLLANTEREQIERALKECRNNKSKAAELLGLTRARLYRRMETLGIRDEPES